MRFLHSSWSRLLLPATIIGLLFSSTLTRAAEASNQAVADAEDIDVAKVQSGGRVVLISSGQRLVGFQAIDDNRRTVIQFLNSDPRPTVVVKVTGDRPIHRVSVVPGSESLKVDVYLFNELPRDPSDLDKVKPLTSIVDLAVGREAAVDFAPQPARYVALRWTPSSSRFEPLKVAEISAFTRPDSTPVSAALAAADPPISLVMGPPVIAPISP